MDPRVDHRSDGGGQADLCRTFEDVPDQVTLGQPAAASVQGAIRGDGNAPSRGPGLFPGPRPHHHPTRIAEDLGSFRSDSRPPLSPAARRRPTARAGDYRRTPTRPQNMAPASALYPRPHRTAGQRTRPAPGHRIRQHDLRRHRSNVRDETPHASGAGRTLLDRLQRTPRVISVSWWE